MDKVFFHAADRSIPIKSRAAIKSLIYKLFKKERIVIDQISFIFCSDEYLLKINEQYLHHSYYTDVIAFCLSTNGPVAGEIYLSTERIKENAKTYGETYEIELLRVMIHGALHICGYRDKTVNQKNEMRLKENFYLQLHSKSFT